ncbi:MAG: hypothetical protein IT204_02375 [Fimbriimonadaceae bacterium]|nr:hypothetical protein [Fimbriimonadaceae bacterium]
MSEDQVTARARLKVLAQLQKTRHLTASELWEAADLLRELGMEDASLEAEAAALRQQAREKLKSPDATFTLGESIDPDLPGSSDASDQWTER